MASSRSAIAPAWHTALVLLWVLGFAFFTAHVSLRHPSGGYRAPSYVGVMLQQWATVVFIWWGLRRRGLHISDLVGGSWVRPIQFLRDLGIGIAFVLIIGGAVIGGLAHLLKAATPESVRVIMPQTRFEMVFWVLMSMTAGFCEELIFRGYLQRQFSALTRSLAGGIVLQAIAFGLGHGYQGWKMTSVIGVYGACFSLLAGWRHSLRPGMLGHALQDAFGGLLSRFLMR